jgi:hypothetical protein
MGRYDFSTHTHYRHIFIREIRFFLIVIINFLGSGGFIPKNQILQKLKGGKMSEARI